MVGPYTKGCFNCKKALTVLLFLFLLSVPTPSHAANSTLSNLWCTATSFFGFPCTEESPTVASFPPPASIDPQTVASNRIGAQGAVLAATTSASFPEEKTYYVTNHFHNVSIISKPDPIIDTTGKPDVYATEDDFVSRSLFDKQVDKIFDRLGARIRDGFSDISEVFSTGILTAETLTVQGNLQSQAGVVFAGLAGGILQTDANGNLSTTTIGAVAIGTASLEDLADVGSMTQNTGDLLYWNGTAWANIATSSLGISGGGGLAAADIDTSAELLEILTDETGTGSAVFSSSPTFTGTLSAAAGMFSSMVTLSGSAANISLGSNYLSGDGDDEGVFVDSSGNVGLGTNTPLAKLSIAQTATLGSELITNGTFTGSATGWTLQSSCSEYGTNNVVVLYDTGCQADAFWPALSTTFSVVSGTTYILTFDITTNGDMPYVYFDNISTSFNDGPFGTGSHSVTFTSDYTGIETIYFESGNWHIDTGWTIDNASIRTIETATAPAFALFDATGATTTVLSADTGNISLGRNALSGVTALYVTGIGSNAGANATNAEHSNFFGSSAGANATDADYANFFGYEAGSGANGASNSHFVGLSAGSGATVASNSNFLGYYAGSGAIGAAYSNFLGSYAGSGAIGANNSNFLGQTAGYGATNAVYSNFFGYFAGYQATNTRYANYIGFQAGRDAYNAYGSNFFGYYAGREATDASLSNFFGESAGYQATNANESNFSGVNAGANAENASQANFFGSAAGSSATNAHNSNFLGALSGTGATDALQSNFIGTVTGHFATNAAYSNFLGYGAGFFATNARHSNFIGYEAGRMASNPATSTFIGYSAGYNADNASNALFLGSFAGYNDTVNNIPNGGSSIAIGRYAGTGGFSNSIALGRGVINSAATQLNIGNLLYGTGIYNSDTQSAAVVGGGKIGIGTSTPSELLTIAGNVRITGALFDSNNSSGISGYVLQSTATGQQWVATSSLGISSGASTFLDLTDTISSYNTGRLLFESGSAVTDSADLTFANSLLTAPTFNASGASTTILSLENQSLLRGSTSTLSVGLGIGALASEVGGTFRQNVAIGPWALYSATTGSGNIAVGPEALFYNTDGNDNIAIGYGALRDNLTDYNIAVGTDALSSLNSGYQNSVIGYGALENLQAGENNISLGYHAGYNLTAGNHNIAIGVSNYFASSTGSNQLNIGNLLFGTGIDGTGTTLSSGNIGIGAAAPSARLTVAAAVPTQGSELITNGTFTGSAAGWSLADCAAYGSNQVTVFLDYDTCGDSTVSTSVALEAGKTYILSFSLTTNGDQAMIEFANNRAYTYGENFFAGDNVLTFTSDYTGTDTISFYSYSWFSDSGWTLDNVSIKEVSEVGPVFAVVDFTGATSTLLNGFNFGNLGYGFNTLQNNSSYKNTAFGINALSSPTRSDNTAVGYAALSFTTFGGQNSAFGSGALSGNSTGNSNTAHGFWALTSNRLGSYNTAVGAQALRSNQASDNTAVGNYALGDNISGADNTAVGEALASNISGSYNIAIGNLALNNNESSSYNVAVGYGAARFNNGTGTIAIGYGAGDNLTSGDRNIIIGYDVNAPTATSDNILNIGNLLYGTGIDGTGTTLSTGNIGIGTSSPSQKLHVQGNARITGALYDNANSAGTNGMVLQTTGSGFAWVATSTLGISSGASTFLALSDTIGSYNTGRLLFESGSAVTDSADLTFANSLLTAPTFNASGASTTLLSINNSPFLVASTTLGTIFLGEYAGFNATVLGYANFIGVSAGDSATNVVDSNFIGNSAGSGAENIDRSNFIGPSSGWGASNVSGSNFMGYNAGSFTTNVSYSNFFGEEAGVSAHNASYSNFFGYYAGAGATNAARSIFIGRNAGHNDTVNNTGSSASTSIAIGNYSGTGGFSNSIALGQGVLNSAVRQLNIGNVLYATGLYNSNTPSATALSGGRLGIGTSTPTQTLTVAGNARITGALYDNANSAGTNGMVLQTTGTGFSWVATSTLGISSGSSSWTTSGSDIYYNSGNVGIGSTTPSQRLTIEDGNILLSSNYAIRFKDWNNQIRQRDSMMGPMSYGNAMLYESENSHIFLADGGSVNDDATMAAFAVGVNGPPGTGSYAERMVVLQNGNVGLGDETPDYTLDVQGTICQDTNSDEVCDGAVTSDERLKTDVENIEDPLAKLAQLRGVTFQWDEENAHTLHLGRGTTHVGMIAQEVEKVFPSLVYEDMKGYRMVDYQKLVGPLVEGVNELNFALSDLLITGSTTAASFANVTEDNTIWSRLMTLGNSFVDDILTLTGIRVEYVQSDLVETEQLCIGETCVNEEQLKALLNDADTPPASQQTVSVPPPAPPATTSPEVIGTDDDTSSEDEVVADEESLIEPAPQDAPEAEVVEDSVADQIDEIVDDPVVGAENPLSDAAVTPEA